MDFAYDCLFGCLTRLDLAGNEVPQHGALVRRAAGHEDPSGADDELVPWWASFVGSIDRIGKLVVDRRLDLLVDRTLNWIDRAVLPSLAMIVTCYGDVGDRLLADWIESAKESLSPRHLAAIREFRYAYEHGTAEEVA